MKFPGQDYRTRTGQADTQAHRQTDATERITITTAAFPGGNCKSDTQRRLFE